MAVMNLKQVEFETIIQNNELVFIDFWASWCSPCKQFSQVYEQVSEQFSSIVFAKVNIEEQQELANRFEIHSIPYLMIFKEGIVVYASAGSLPELTLKELAQQSLSVDVHEISAQLEQPE